MDLLLRRSADISACGAYRYRLTRSWGSGHMLPFVMLNPSTADADIDDPTIRRCMGFARREGAGGIVVVNLFAYRSVNPAVLHEVGDPFGPSNAAALADVARDAVRSSGVVVCAWGASVSVRGADRSAIRLLRHLGARLVTLGVTQAGHPRHPLYVKSNQSLVEFDDNRP
jgi:hypothetical protein